LVATPEAGGHRGAMQAAPQVDPQADVPPGRTSIPRRLIINGAAPPR
jgi:hypothetical protein